LQTLILLAHHFKDLFGDFVNCCNTIAEVSSLIDVCGLPDHCLHIFHRVRVRVTLQLMVSWSVGQSVLAPSPSGIHDQILAVVKTDAVLFVMGHPPWWKNRSVCNRSESFSVLAVYTYVLSYLCFLCVLHIYSMDP